MSELSVDCVHELCVEEITQCNRIFITSVKHFDDERVLEDRLQRRHSLLVDFCRCHRLKS